MDLTTATRMPLASFRSFVATFVALECQVMQLFSFNFNLLKSAPGSECVSISAPDLDS